MNFQPANAALSKVHVFFRHKILKLANLNQTKVLLFTHSHRNFPEQAPNMQKKNKIKISRCLLFTITCSFASAFQKNKIKLKKKRIERSILHILRAAGAGISSCICWCLNVKHFVPLTGANRKTGHSMSSLPASPPEKWNFFVSWAGEQCPKKKNWLCPRSGTHQSGFFLFFLSGYRKGNITAGKRKVLGVVVLKGINSKPAKVAKLKKKKPGRKKLKFTTYPWNRCSIYSKLSAPRAGTFLSSEDAEAKRCFHLFSGNISWGRSCENPKVAACHQIGRTQSRSPAHPHWGAEKGEYSNFFHPSVVLKGLLRW